MDKLTFPRMVQSFTTLSLVLFALLLSSCSTPIAHHDGPPHYYVDETKIPDAVPTPTPLSKIGNKPSYVVFGRRYYTLRSSKNYSEIGIASWYGTQFHTHFTSNGERYNMLAMTAAHKTLPLPTYVEVTNLKNHRHIIVKVNDRGPFATNRIIDLSYVAAKKLHMLGHGTALVRVRAIDPMPYSHPIEMARHSQSVAPIFTNTTSPHPQHISVLYLQVGAFRQRERAEKFQQHLMTRLSSPVNIADPSLKNKLYRVQVGPFNNMEAANKMNGRLKQMGIKSNRTYGA